MALINPAVSCISRAGTLCFCLKSSPRYVASPVLVFDKSDLRTVDFAVPNLLAFVMMLSMIAAPAALPWRVTLVLGEGIRSCRRFIAVAWRTLFVWGSQGVINDGIVHLALWNSVRKCLIKVFTIKERVCDPQLLTPRLGELKTLLSRISGCASFF